MDLNAVADDLYGVSPEEFIERRKERAAEARNRKDRALAQAITALRRPTRSAWLVNLVARKEPDAVTALLALGTALGEAQQRGAGADLRRLSQERHSALEKLSRRAVELAAQQGHAAAEATRLEVTQTLQAALADPAVAELVRAGRVVQPASYGGFGPMSLLVVAPPPGGADSAAVPQAEGEAAPDAEAAPGDQPEPPVREDPARRQAEAAVEAAAQALESARQEAAQAEDDAQQATTDADARADRVEALRAQLEQAEEDERRSRQTARAARKRAQELQQVVATAEQALATAQEARAALDPP